MDDQPRQAEAMTPAAIGRLGVNYWHGWGVPQNYALAVNQFRIAAAGGDIAANFWLGVAMAEGRGAPQDEQAARVHLTKAADAGDQAARSYLDTLALKAKQGRGYTFGLKAYLLAVAGGAVATLLAVFLHQGPIICALAFLAGVGAVVLLGWLMKPEPDKQAAALAAVANQQVHGATQHDEGTI